MRNISLLPEQYKKDIVLSRKLSITAVVSLILAVVALFAYGLTGLLMLSPLIELESMKSQNIQVSSQITDLKPLVELYNEINVNVGNFEKAVKGTLPANMVVYGLCSDIPEEIILLKLSVSFNSSKGDLKAVVEGIASNKENLVLWMDALKENQYVHAVMCKTLEEYGDSSGKKTARFTLEIPLEGGDRS